VAEGYYDEEAFRKWEAARRDYEVVFGEIVTGKIAEVTQGMDPLILDVGSGEGYTAQLLEDSGMTVVSIDLDEKALSNERWLPGSEDMPRAVARTEQLPFAANSFGLITGISGFETLVTHPFTEFSRVLSPGAKILMTNDSPRGLRRILPAPLEYGYDELGHDEDEAVVVTFDSTGEISEPVIVKREAIDSQLADITQRRGLPTLTIDHYLELAEDDQLETIFAGVYAEAAAICLAQGKGLRPFEFNSQGGAWNRLFYEDFASFFRDAGFESCRIESPGPVEILRVPVELANEEGTPVFVGRILRDSVGNVYYCELTPDRPEHTILQVNTTFLVAENAQR